MQQGRRLAVAARHRVNKSASKAMQKMQGHAPREDANKGGLVGELMAWDGPNETWKRQSFAGSAATGVQEDGMLRRRLGRHSWALAFGF